MRKLSALFLLASVALAAETLPQQPPVPAENHRALVNALQAQRDEQANKAASFAAQLEMAMQRLQTKDAEIGELKRKLAEKEKPAAPAVAAVGEPPKK